ncbi:MAG: fatty acid desaturase [Candidatus Omnitrophica bacterium]|nr:fatty acid desaturase [Candidatus Omnitrophota bacterium]
MIELLEKVEEVKALKRFQEENQDLFKKDDSKLLLHLGLVLSLLITSTLAVVFTPWLWLKIVLGAWNALLWFSLINATIHHHHTHHNATRHPLTKRFLDILYFLAVPNAPKRLGRYTRTHLNHHARPFHETDVDHHYGKTHYLKMKKSLWTQTLYYLELTFIGGNVPGWEDNRYMNEVPLEEWNQRDYEKIKEEERKRAVQLSLVQWGFFGILLWLFPAFAWGWVFPILLVKNWAHFLGQFQHYDDAFLDPARSVWNRTKTYRFPGWLNYLVGGEISGHFLHHLFPELPYYNVETARKRLVKNPDLSKLFVTY